MKPLREQRYRALIDALAAACIRRHACTTADGSARRGGLAHFGLTQQLEIHHAARAPARNAAAVQQRTVEHEQPTLARLDFAHDAVVVVEEHRVAVGIVDVVKQDEVGEREVDVRLAVRVG